MDESRRALPAHLQPEATASFGLAHETTLVAVGTVGELTSRTAGLVGGPGLLRMTI